MQYISVFFNSIPFEPKPSVSESFDCDLNPPPKNLDLNPYPQC